MSFKSIDKPTIDESLLEDLVEEPEDPIMEEEPNLDEETEEPEKPEVPGKEKWPEETILYERAIQPEEDGFSFLEAANELKGLSDQCFERAEEVNSPRRANALEAKGDLLLTEAYKFQDLEHNRSENCSIASWQKSLLRLRAAAHEVLTEPDISAEPQVIEKPKHYLPGESLTFQQINEFRDFIDYDFLKKRAAEPLEPSTDIEALGDSYYIDEAEALEEALHKVCPFCKKRISKKDIDEARGEGNEGTLLMYGNRYYHCECFMKDILIHSKGDPRFAAQKFNLQQYYGELLAFKMGWLVDYGAYYKPDSEENTATAGRDVSVS